MANLKDTTINGSLSLVPTGGDSIDNVYTVLIEHNNKLSKDCIYEEYIDGLYKVRHWASGFSEAWLFVTDNISYYTTFASLYGYKYEIDIPEFIFNSKPNFIYNCNIGTGFTFPGNNSNFGGSSMNKLVFLMGGTSNSSTSQINIQAYIWGTWDSPVTL